jgi:heme-degrading monooxygenase HmoA
MNQMIMKWIVCKVNRDSKEEFSQAQEQWAALYEVQGFLGQIGGWNLRQPLEACIVSFWKDNASYQNFMSRIHDQIFYKSNQKQTYHSITIALCESIMNILGTYGHILTSLGKGKVLRIADCTLYKDRIKHFIEALKDIWNPGMSDTDGMLAGVLTKVNGTPNRYLAATLWTDEIFHQYYLETMVPVLQERAQYKRFFESIDEKIIQLQDSWTVIGNNKE